MNKVIKILMERDGMTEEEAKDLVAETREILIETQDETVIEDMLGLETDYIFDIMF